MNLPEEGAHAHIQTGGGSSEDHPDRAESPETPRNHSDDKPYSIINDTEKYLGGDLQDRYIILVGDENHAPECLRKSDNRPPHGKSSPNCMRCLVTDIENYFRTAHQAGDVKPEDHSKRTL